MQQVKKQLQITRNAHWVPQAYLRAFAAEHDPKRIWRFHHSEGEPELKRIDKVAYRHHLYAPRDTNSGMRDDTQEKKLADLENWFGHSIWQALGRDVVDLSWQPLRKIVSLLAAVMFLRNPRRLELHKDVHRRLVEAWSEGERPPKEMLHGANAHALDTETWPAFRDADEDGIKRMWLRQMNNAAHYAKLFMSMRWSMTMAARPTFITSDDPMTFLHPSLEFRGINDPETYIRFPISPTRVLCMDHRYEEPANQYYMYDDEGCVAVNLFIWRNSLDYMFCHRHPDYVLKELLIAEAWASDV